MLVQKRRIRVNSHFPVLEFDILFCSITTVSKTPKMSSPTWTKLIPQGRQSTQIPRFIPTCRDHVEKESLRISNSFEAPGVVTFQHFPRDQTMPSSSLFHTCQALSRLLNFNDDQDTGGQVSSLPCQCSLDHRGDRTGGFCLCHSRTLYGAGSQKTT